MSSASRFKPCWTNADLVIVGVFAAVIKASTILVAFAGGGMNPVTLFAKNCLYVLLMVVLLHKVPRPFTMTLTAGITSLVSLLLMGQGIMTLPGTVAGYLVGEMLILGMGGYGKTANILAGLTVGELIAKALGLGVSWLVMREQPGMLIPATIFVCIGSLGVFAGLFAGVRFMKELRHAGIISY